MVLDNYDFHPKGEWLFSTIGFAAGTIIGTAGTGFIASGMILGVITGTIGWLICFYDENF